MGEAVTVKLTRFAQKQPPTDVNQHIWSIMVTAQGYGGMPSEIFVHKVDDPNVPLDGDTFENIASVSDLNDFPKVRNPGALVEEDELQIPFYRSSKVELEARSAEEAEVIWAKIQDHTTELIKNYVSTLTLEAMSTYTSTVVDGAADQVEEIINMSKPVRVTLAFEPNGTAAIDGGNDQTITAPYDIDIKGWLPVSEIPAHFVDAVPANTTFFYNIDKHSDLKALFPLDVPLDTHQLHHEGFMMTYNGVYVFTRDTIYWKTFTPGDFSEFGVTGNAPWAIDYVDRNNPGDGTDLNVLIFTQT